MQIFKSLVLGLLLLGYIALSAVVSFAADDAKAKTTTTKCPTQKAHSFVYDLAGALPKDVVEEFENAFKVHRDDAGFQTAIIVSNNPEAEYENCIDAWGFNKPDTDQQGILIVFFTDGAFPKVGISSSLVKEVGIDALLKNIGQAIAKPRKGKDLPRTIRGAVVAAWYTLDHDPEASTENQ